MKFIVIADDYGMTYGVTDGIVTCGREGILTETGLFTNMPSSEYAVRRYKEEIPHVLLGQDLNLSTGRPVTDPKLIPTLVNEDGSFLTSRQHRVRDAEKPDNVAYEDVLLEYENQIKRYIELVGDKPGYFSGHAWHTKMTDGIILDLCKKYDVIYKHTEVPMETITVGGWATPIVREDKSYDYSITVQVTRDPVEIFEKEFKEMLQQRVNDDVLVKFHTHAGFMDRDLVKLSSFTAVRPMEAGLLCSKVIKDFVRDNNIELVNIKQLV